MLKHPFFVFVLWLVATAAQVAAAPIASNWHSLGPVNMTSPEPSMGRVNAVTMHPADSQTLFLCSASGGVWSSSDGGHNWVPRTDGLPLLGTSGLVIDPLHPNIMYLATGDADAMDTPSIGVWKSVDGGTNWNATGFAWPESADNGIYKLMIHPTDPNRLFAATTDGLYSSTDGAATWQRQTPDTLTFWYDIAFQPGNPSVLYAISQQARLYRSVDTGATWQPMAAGLPTTGVERSALGVSPANPNGVYVLCSSAMKSDFFGLYRSTNGGTSFVQRASNATPTVGSSFGTQGFFDTTVGVSPSDFNLVYVAGVGITKSIDGGTTWTNVVRGINSGLCHVDFHALQFFGGTLYACSDGGLHRTSDGALNWEDLSASLQIGQIYRTGSAAQNPYLSYIGTQDNGLNQYANGQWSHVSGGDFAEVVVDFLDEKVVYAVGNGVLYKSIDGWRTNAPLTISATEFPNSLMPVVMHPTNHLVLYAGLGNVYRSTDAGTTWQRLSNFPDTNTACRRITQAASNPNFIYVTRGTNIWRTSDGGLSWTNMTHNLPGGGPLSSVAVSSTDPNNVWVTLNRFYNSGARVYHSLNGGGSWSDYSGSLPARPVNTIVYEAGSNDGLYLGLEPGVYYRDGSMADWQPFMSNLPNVKISELEVHYGSLKLRAATYGRGLWETYLAGAAPQLPVLTGPSVLSVNQGAAYTFPPVTKAIGYQSRQGRLQPFVLNDGAENGLTNFTAVVATNYTVVQSAIVGSGSFAFHLAHGLPMDQTLTLNTLLRPRTNAQVQFKSRLGTSTASQIAKVEVSTNQGVTWQSVYAQSGNSTGESTFTNRTIGLSNYVGMTVQVRFNYALGPGNNYFSQTSKNFGWYLDDIGCSGFDQVSNPTITDVSGTNFTFTAAQAGDYLLEARAKVYGPYYMEFGPAKIVSVVNTPIVQITSLQHPSANTWQVNFSLLGGTAASFQLYKSDDLSSQWTQDTGASIQTLAPGSSYRAVTTSTAPQRFYRVKPQ